MSTVRRVDSSALQVGQVLTIGSVRFLVQMTAQHVSQVSAEAETLSVGDAVEMTSSQFHKLPLSAAERRVFDLLLPGLAEKEIARCLGISRHTVHSHVRKIYKLFDVRSRAELLGLFVKRPTGTSGDATATP